MVRKPQACAACPLAAVTSNNFVPIEDVGTAELIVGEAPGEEEDLSGRPFVGGSGRWLDGMLKQARLLRSQFCVANTMLCRPPRNVYPTDPDSGIDPEVARAGVEYCWRTHVEPFIRSRRWSRIIALGAKALKALTGRDGIEQWRGSPLPLSWELDRPVVIPTYHPAYLMRQPGKTVTSIIDLRKHPTIPPEDYNLWPTVEQVEQFSARRFAFDLEWDSAGNIVLCGLSAAYYTAMVVPFSGAYVQALRRIFEEAEELIGHNIIMADVPYLTRLGWRLRARLWDTMLMHHLVQPDMPKSLAYVGSIYTNKPYWKGYGALDVEETAASKTHAQWHTWALDSALPRTAGGYGGCTSDEEAFRLYNARDTDVSFQVFMPLQTALRKYNLETLYEALTVPIATLCREMEERGLAVDHSALADIRAGIQAEINELDAALPDGLRSYRVPVVKSVKLDEPRVEVLPSVCKGTRDFPHEPLEVAADVTECPRCGRRPKARHRTIRTEKRQVGEKVIYPWNNPRMVLEYARKRGMPDYTNPKTGRLSSDKNARKVWGRRAPEFYTVDVLKEKQVLLQSFAKPRLIDTDRMYFQLLPHGTATGRLSSKGLRKGVDLNVQNIPDEMKQLFVPEPGYVFVKADVSQGENILTALLAGDSERLARLHTPGFDEHAWTATACFGVEVTKTNEHRHLRQAGKRINHMVNYGASWKKLREVMLIDGFDLPPETCRKLLEQWRATNPKTAEWQDRTVALAQAQGYLVNPFGRRRWFKGVPDLGPKALAFLPSSTLADCVLRMMVALHASRFGRELDRLGVQRRVDLPEGAYLALQVHDEIVLAAPEAVAEEAAERLRWVMEQPWPELGGYAFRVEVRICRKSLKE